MSSTKGSTENVYIYVLSSSRVFFFETWKNNRGGEVSLEKKRTKKFLKKINLKFYICYSIDTLLQ